TLNMTTRRLFSSIIALAALLVAASGILLSSKPPARAGGGSAPPYYKRTGFLSNLMLELNNGAKGPQSIHAPDGFEVSVAAGPRMVPYPMFIAFDDRGRLFVCESAGRNISDQEMDRQSEMRVRLLEDTDHDGVFDRSTIFADKISMTMGAQWY